MNESFDLDQFEDMPTAQVVLKNPATGAPTSAVIEILGPENNIRKNFQFSRIRKARAVIQRTGKIEMSDPADDIDSETDFLVVCTAGWSGLTSAGAPLEFSPAAARALYTDPKRQWVRGQVKKAVDEAERFINASAKA